MKEHFKTFGGTVNKLQIFIGAAGLIIGIFVYLTDRPPDQTYFIYKSGLDISLYKILPSLFGPIGNHLPAFIHVFSFILITAGLIAYQKRKYIIICLFWFLIDSAFELGQRFNTLIIEFIPDWFGGIPFLENSKYYFLKGTFDFGDMAAIFVGTIAAYFILINTNERGKSHYEKGKQNC